MEIVDILMDTLYLKEVASLENELFLHSPPEVLRTMAVFIIFGIVKLIVTTIIVMKGAGSTDYENNQHFIKLCFLLLSFLFEGKAGKIIKIEFNFYFKKQKHQKS